MMLFSKTQDSAEDGKQILMAQAVCRE